MNLSIFDVIGPVMVGPSSSHTAGAVRLARTAAKIAGKPFHKVTFGLHGSFAETGYGHGTDKALLAGVLGYQEDDVRIRDVKNEIGKFGIEYSFYQIDLPDEHENSCKITFFHNDDSKSIIVGSSIGGGRIKITNINGLLMEIRAEQPTILISQHDEKGVISEISSVLAHNGINIGAMRVTRERKGDIAVTVIETDGAITDQIVSELRNVHNVMQVRII